VDNLLSNRVGPYRDYGSGVMYAPGKVLVMGGGDPPTRTAEVINLNDSSPAWRAVGLMKVARRQLNATLLPDGTVLVTGGTSKAGFNTPDDPGSLVHCPEIWNPATEAWTTTTLASSLGIPRIYHSTALPLPDGRVLSMGGNNQTTSEIYSPPYLFKGPRPTIAYAPTSVLYGQSFFVQTSDAIDKVTMLRLSSVTHAFNMSQYISTLSFSQDTGGLNVVAPSADTVAPPGLYMLFILNGSGVPSSAKTVQVGSGPAAPTLTSLSPSSKVAGELAFTLTVNGSNFVSGSVVRWNGENRPTAFVSTNQLTAQVPATDIAAAGTASVTVQNPPKPGDAWQNRVGGPVSNALPFTITGASPSPPPTLTSLSPSSAAAGAADFMLTVNGSNFVNGSMVRWNGQNRTTTFVSATQLTASIPANDIAAAGTALVTVQNPPFPGGAVSTNALTFTITPAAPAPLTITTSSLPNARMGTPYSAPLAASGGTPPYTWSIASGILPPGLLLNPPDMMNPDTRISGTPLPTASTTSPYRFTVRVSDAVNPFPGGPTKQLSIKVNKR
jgi:hypothetical protein